MAEIPSEESWVRFTGPSAQVTTATFIPPRPEERGTAGDTSCVSPFQLENQTERKLVGVNTETRISMQMQNINRSFVYH